ncbi:MAG: hypothetical protein IJ338_06975 [Bacteroidaceae bacterium]|nr:hypothetical protein [Bacteroidaceae bacterium]
MINQILKHFIDFIYGTKKIERRFKAEHPNETVLASDACKGISPNQDKDVKGGSDWITAQRAVILLTDKRIVCGKWDIPLCSITDAHLIEYSSLFSSGQVLKIQTENGKFYQFGMQKNPEWINQSALPLSLEKGQSTNSVFRFLFWLIILGYLAYSFI